MEGREGGEGEKGRIPFKRELGIKMVIFKVTSPVIFFSFR